MVQFDDLQQAYLNDGAASVFTRVDALSAQERYDLLVANAPLRKRTRHIGDEDKAEKLPDAYRRIKTRWGYFDEILNGLEGTALRHHMEPHIEFETDGGTYLRNTLALLVWKSVDEQQAEGN